MENWGPDWCRNWPWSNSPGVAESSFLTQSPRTLSMAWPSASSTQQASPSRWLEADVIYWGPQNNHVSDNSHHMSSALLLKIYSLGQSSAHSDNVQSVVVTYLLSASSGEFWSGNISRAISLFSVEHGGMGLSHQPRIKLDQLPSPTPSIPAHCLSSQSNSLVPGFTAKECGQPILRGSQHIRS